MIIDRGRRQHAGDLSCSYDAEPARASDADAAGPRRRPPRVAIRARRRRRRRGRRRAERRVDRRPAPPTVAPATPGRRRASRDATAADAVKLESSSTPASIEVPIADTISAAVEAITLPDDRRLEPTTEPRRGLADCGSVRRPHRGAGLALARHQAADRRRGGRASGRRRRRRSPTSPSRPTTPASST